MEIDLPVHPRTGLRAIAMLPSGKPLWPLMGGDGTAPVDEATAVTVTGPDSTPAAPAAAPAAPAAPTTTPPAAAAPAAPTTTRVETTAATAAAPRDDDEDDDDDGLTWKQLSRKHERRSRDNFNRANSAEAKVLQYEVALEKGLSLSLAKRLVGSTREELAADADALVAELGSKNGAKPQGGATSKPREALKPGAVPDAEAEPDYDAIAKEVLTRPPLVRR